MEVVSERCLAESWAEAHDRLIENIIVQNYLPREKVAACARVGSRRRVLPAYIPYIGSEYFRFRPRVLCYAINQNLSKHTRWTHDWCTEWGADPGVAIDRLNEAAAKGKALPIKPYAEGFIPLAATILLAQVGRQCQAELPPVVDRVIAVTNFVKFSTGEDASSSSIPTTWWRECAERYVELEIGVLRPDILLSFGQRTTLEVERVLNRLYEANNRPRLLGCRFPGRIPSIRACPLSGNELAIWQRQIRPLVSRIQKPSRDSYHKWRMLDFPGYFLRLWERIGDFTRSGFCAL